MLLRFKDSVADPITRLELHQWRKQKSQLWLTFLGFPILLSAALWLSLLTTRGNSDPDLIQVGLFTNLWGAQVILSVWLSAVVTLRAATTIARERESGNWTLLKITPYSSSDIFWGKTQAIWMGLRWPMSLVVALRIASLIFGYLTTVKPSLTETVLTAVFIYVFCGELLISVYYNCTIGLLASALAKTSAQAHGVAYGLHLLLFIFCFAPLWWNYLYGGYGLSVIYSGANIGTLWTTLAQYCILCVAQLIVAAISYSLAIHLADRFTD